MRLFAAIILCLICCTAVGSADERSFAASLREHVHYDQSGPNTVGHLYIGDHRSQISQATWLYVKKALEYYREKKPIFIILELDTPGGEVFAAQKISDALKEMDTQYNIPVIAFINNWAISAGAMLAYSCRYIVPVKDASMGAAEPLVTAGGETQTASEKVNSAIRTDFGNRANYFDRDPNLAEAMVDKDIILVYRKGKIVRLQKEDEIVTRGSNKDIVITAEGKLLTLNAEQMLDYGVADVVLKPERLVPVTEVEKEEGRWPLAKSPLSQITFLQGIPDATVDSFQMDWKTQFFAFLANPVVSSLIFMGMLMGFYLEFNTPGFGVPGTLGLTCLILLIFSSFALDIANWFELILVFVGLALIVVDLFIIPTFGLMGFIGIIFFLSGFFAMMLPGLENIEYEFDTNTMNAAGEVFIQRLAWLCGSFAVAVVLMILSTRYVTPSLAGFTRLVLQGGEQDASKGYIAGDAPVTLPQSGSRGEVVSTLRPSGKVMIGDTIYDAVSEGSFLEKGTPITVAKLDGSVIVVEEVADETENHS